MKLITLGEAKAAVAIGAAQEMKVTPFMQKHNVVVMLCPSPNFNGTHLIQTSDDGTNWTTVLTLTGTNQPVKQVEVQLGQYMRENMTAFTAGSCSAFMLADN